MDLKLLDSRLKEVSTEYSKITLESLENRLTRAFNEYRRETRDLCDLENVMIEQRLEIFRAYSDSKQKVRLFEALIATVEERKAQISEQISKVKSYIKKCDDCVSSNRLMCPDCRKL